MLSNMCQLIQSAQSFGIITPYLPALTELENKERLIELKKMVRNAGFGSIVLFGGFEIDGKSYQHKSIFIGNLKKKQILNWGKVFNQFSIIYKDEHEFIEIECETQFEINAVRNDYYQLGWNKNMSFDSELAKVFFTHIAQGYLREKRLEIEFKNVFLKEMIPLSFNERAYHGKKTGDERLVSILG